MAKGRAFGKLLKGAGKAIGGAFKAVGGLVMDGLKSLTSGGGGKSDSKITAGSSKTSNEVKTEVSKLTNTKPEPDKLAEQDNRAAESEVQASKVTEAKSRNDKNKVQSISNRTRSILQNYGLKGELVRTIKKEVKNEGVQSESSSRVMSQSDIFNIYQQKAPNINIDKVVEMLAANNEILANVNETIRLIHNQGTIETEFKKIKGEKAKVLSEKAKDEAESVNKSTDKSNQKLAEYKAQALAIKDALHDDLAKTGSIDPKLLELLAQQQIAKAKEDEEKDEEGEGGLLGLLAGALPMLLSFMPTGLLSKGAGFLSKSFSKLTSTVGGAWDGLKNMLGFGDKGVAKGAAEVASKDAVKATASKKVAKSGLKEFFKKLSPRALRVITKKFIARAMLKAAAKGAGKAAIKKIPIAGAVAGIGFGIERCMGNKPDYAGAALDVASGIASIFPGVGTGISAALDVAGIVRDVNNAIDDMKNGEIDPEMFTEEELAEVLVDPTQEELELDAAQEENASKQNSIDTGLMFIPGIGQVAAGLRAGYRYLKDNGVIEGNATLDKLAGVKSTEELKSDIAEKKAAKSGGSSGWTPSTTPVHKEAKASNKVFKGVSVLDNNKSGSDGNDMELGESGGEFTLSSEQRDLMNYWKDHKANPTDPEAAQRLVDYWKSYEGKLSYSQEVRDINQGSTDCSGMVTNSMQNVFGMNIDDGTGTYAAALATNRIGAVVTKSDIDESGNGSGRLTQEMIDQLQPGDVIYTRLDRWKGKRPYAVGHASLYIGNGKVLSQGGYKDQLGPYQTDLSYYDGKFVLAKRYFGTGNAEITKADLESTSAVKSSATSISSRVASLGADLKGVARIASTSSTNAPINKPTSSGGSSVQKSIRSNSDASTQSNPVSMKDDHSVNDNSSTVNNYNYTYNINNGVPGTPDLKQMS